MNFMFHLRFVPRFIGFILILKERKNTFYFSQWKKLETILVFILFKITCKITILILKT